MMNLQGLMALRQMLQSKLAQGQAGVGRVMPAPATSDPNILARMAALAGNHIMPAGGTPQVNPMGLPNGGQNINQNPVNYTPSGIPQGVAQPHPMMPSIPQMTLGEARTNPLQGSVGRALMSR